MFQKKPTNPPSKEHRSIAVQRSATALPALSLLMLVAGGLLGWSMLTGPAEGASKSPHARMAGLVAAPEPAAPAPAAASRPALEPEAGAARVEAQEEPSLVAAKEGEEPPPSPEARETSAAAEKPQAPPEARPAPAKEPTAPTPAQPTDQVEEEESEDARALLLAALAESSPPLYVPPSRGMPSLRVGGGTRGAAGELPKPLAAAPSQVGLTAEPSPTLYWFLSEESEVPAQFALSDPDAIDPILELDIPPPIEAGLHAVSLSERGVVLQPGTQYRWFVSLVPDAARRSRDVIAGGAIDRIQPGEKLGAELEAADPSQLGHVYAQNGLWYDALGFLSGWIEEYPQEPRLRAQRAALLEQVGLEEAAAWERRAAQAQP